MLYPKQGDRATEDCLLQVRQGGVAVIKTSILFLCTGNSRRTQMAEGFLRALAGDHYDVVSAGSEETPLDPDAVAAMREVGIDISAQESKAVSRFLGKRFSYVVTLCDREKERTCPIFRSDLALAVGSGRPFASQHAGRATCSDTTGAR